MKPNIESNGAAALVNGMIKLIFSFYLYNKQLTYIEILFSLIELN